MGYTEERILVLGLGNILMGDEGVGVHAINHMKKSMWPDFIDLMDGGTGGFHLMHHIESYPYVIMVDATLDGQPGYMKVIQPKFASDFPPAMSTHDIGMKDLIEGLILLNTMPKVDLIAVSIQEIQPMKMNLSRDVRLTIPVIERTVRALVDDYFEWGRMSA